MLLSVKFSHIYAHIWQKLMKRRHEYEREKGGVYERRWREKGKGEIMLLCVLYSLKIQFLKWVV